MSAIAGLIDWRGGPAGPAVRKATAALTRHGRDGEGLWDGGDVALGWRQTILHAEDHADHQPLAGGGGRFQLVFDGRIDNRTDLTEALAFDPERARAAPDSAFVLAAFEKWGESCAEHLLGDFAFAIWDQNQRVLFLARDHIGQKPLHYHRGDGFFMFATMPSALFTNAEVPRDLDDENFLLELAGMSIERDATTYRGVNRVRIGEALSVTERGVKRLRHWRPEEISPLRYKRDDDYLEDFKSRLDAAVACRLRGLHPIGSQLSSGWDSSTVTVTAARLLGARGQGLTAFTAVPPTAWSGFSAEKRLTDEGPIAADIARRFSNIEHVLIPGSGRLDMDALDRHAGAYELAAKVANNVGWQERLYGEARARGIRVMLSGVTGNRTVSYDGLGLLAQAFRHGDLSTLLREGLALHRGGSGYKHLAALTFGPYLPEVVWKLIRRVAKTPNPIARMRTGVNPDALSEQRLFDIARKGRLCAANAHRADDRTWRVHCTTSPDLGVLHGRDLAAYDVETRDPTSDRRLMAFRAAVPEHQFLRNGRTKWLVKRAMTGVLPDELFQHEVRGLQAAEWFDAASQSRDALSAEIVALASNPRMRRLVDIPLLEQLSSEWPSRLTEAEQIFLYRRFLSVLIPARFARRLIEQAI